ncbi:hypothetical protein [Campylobacter sp. RM12651]|uniref:hypothetical protein n=1 Tax=Campylobacter sp. RM12651 TaxID=1660079 RepID=UPI001EFA3E56|nr:hypothetical protein [Campylobacter sp. RM12651]ULO04545.1 putative membrane protein [Campylobacter sp. RM12651]
MFFDYVVFGFNELAERYGIFFHIFNILSLGFLITSYGMFIYLYRKGEERDSIEKFKIVLPILCIMLYLGIWATQNGYKISEMHTTFGVIGTCVCLIAICYILLLMVTWAYFFKWKKLENKYN